MNSPVKTASPERSALARLRARQPVFGALQMIPSPIVTEVMVWSGFDFVILDCEHCVVDEPAQLSSFQVTTNSNAFAMVRVRSSDLSAVGRYLDLGASGILLPDVRSPRQAADFVAAALPGPRGTRSSTGSGARANRYGFEGNGEKDPPLLLAMIEGTEAVSRIDEIAATPGLSGLVIGPNDLSADLGCPGDFNSNAYREAFAAIERAASRAGILLGSQPHPNFPIARLIEAGHSFILISGDVMSMRDGFRTHLTAAKAVGAGSLPQSSA